MKALRTPVTTEDVARRLAPTTLMYHGTSSEFLRSILKHGLTPDSKGRWTSEEVDLQASQQRSSVKSYGGIYFTTNFMVAYSSATNLIQKKEAHKGANPVIICAHIQPQASLPDEDHYHVPVRRFINESLFPNVLLGERANIDNDPQAQYKRDFNRAIQEFVYTYVGKKGERAEALEKRIDKGELHSLAREVILAEIERQYAHISKKIYKSYDTSEHRLRKMLSILEPKKTWFGAEGETVESLPKEVEPKTVKQAEEDYRSALDAFIRKTKNITKAELEENKNRTNLRIMEPVTFSGRNRIVAVIEIDRYHTDDKDDRIVIHYGTMPEKFKENYMEGIGELPPIVKSLKMDKAAMWDHLKIPARAGTTPIPKDHVRLYHQTHGDHLLGSLKHKGIILEHARGIEGPRAIYADENGFYRKPHEGATVEFHVHKDRWHPPFVTGDDVKPDDIIAVHHTWHETARYIEEDPELLQEVIAGKHDGLLEKGTGKYNKAIRYIKHKYKGKTDTASLNIDTAAKPDFNYTVDKDGLVMLLPNTPQAEKIYNQIVKQVGAGKLLPQQFEAVQAALKKAKYTLHKSKPSSSLLKDDEKLLRELGIDKADFDVASDYEFYKYGGDRGVSLSITKGGETKNYAIRKGEVFGVKPSMKGPTFSSVITKTTGERTVFTVSTSDLKRLLKASKKYSPENVNKEITPSHLALMHEAWKNAAPRLRGGKEAHLYVFTKWANIHTGVNIDVHDIYEALAYRRNKGLDEERLSDKTYISSVNRGVKAFVQLFGRDLFEDAIVDLAKWIVTPRSKPSELAKNLMKLHDKRWKTSANQYVKIH